LGGKSSFNEIILHNKALVPTAMSPRKLARCIVWAAIRGRGTAWTL